MYGDFIEIYRIFIAYTEWRYRLFSKHRCFPAINPFLSDWVTINHLTFLPHIYQNMYVYVAMYSNKHATYALSPIIVICDCMKTHTLEVVLNIAIGLQAILYLLHKFMQTYINTIIQHIYLFIYLKALQCSVTMDGPLVSCTSSQKVTE